MNTDYTDKKNKITQINARVVSNKKIISNYYKLVLKTPEIAKYAQPGQFLNIKVNNSYEPLLRRPLSIHRVDGLWVMLLYETVGKGTEILSQRKAADYLDVIGPLGNGFDYDGRGRMDEGRRILVAGGMGTAPLVFLAEKLQARKSKEERRGKKDEGRGTIVLLGAKTKDDILCEKEFKKFGCEVKIATDDGSRGFKGYVSDLLKKELSSIQYPVSSIQIYACGPKPMLKEISRISQKYNIPAQISLEAHIACGIGACMGCVIKTKDEARLPARQGRSKRDAFQYKRVCYEGPVFEANQILWE